MAKIGLRADSRRRYHSEAYRFVVEALHFTQQRLSRPRPQSDEDQSAHITGQELLIGLKEFASRQFGMLAASVLRNWGIRVTDDVGRIVFELIERGEMRKTERDCLNDFSNLYDFQQAFVDDYRVDVASVFRKS